MVYADRENLKPDGLRQNRCLLDVSVRQLQDTNSEWATGPAKLPLLPAIFFGPIAPAGVRPLARGRSHRAGCHFSLPVFRNGSCERGCAQGQYLIGLPARVFTDWLNSIQDPIRLAAAKKFLWFLPAGHYCEPRPAARLVYLYRKRRISIIERVKSPTAAGAVR